MLTLGLDSFIVLSDADQYFQQRLHSSDWPQAQAIPDPAGYPNADHYTETVTRIAAENETRALRLESALRTATAILDRQQWRGFVTAYSQPLAWPRQGLADGEGRIIPADAVPLPVQHAAAELALALLRNDLTRDDRQGIAARQVGDLRIQYRPTMNDPLPRLVRDLLRPFLLTDAHGAPLIP